jgi:hypothetical protein
MCEPTPVILSMYCPPTCPCHRHCLSVHCHRTVAATVTACQCTVTSLSLPPSLPVSALSPHCYCHRPLPESHLPPPDPPSACEDVDLGRKQLLSLLLLLLHSRLPQPAAPASAACVMFGDGAGTSSTGCTSMLLIMLLLLLLTPAIVVGLSLAAAGIGSAAGWSAPARAPVEKATTGSSCSPLPAWLPPLRSVSGQVSHPRGAPAPAAAAAAAVPSAPAVVGGAGCSTSVTIGNTS